jgi:hypothetical protein
MNTENGQQPELPTRYEIQKLLDEAIQPWDALTEQEVESLARGIGRNQDPLAVPVVLSREGRLVDGSQRLLALQKLGRKYVNAVDVRVAPQITHANGLEWAIRLNTQRRQLDIPQKARVVRMLMAKNGWSQNRVAKVFGVSGAAISQWLGMIPPVAGEELPTEVIGEDGVMQDVSAKRRERLNNPRKITPHTWSDRGEGYSLIRRTTARLRGVVDHPDLAPLSDLSLEEQDALIAVVQDLHTTTMEVLTQLCDDH